jgi:hypothetical protein
MSKNLKSGVVRIIATGLDCLSEQDSTGGAATARRSTLSTSGAPTMTSSAGFI